MGNGDTGEYPQIHRINNGFCEASVHHKPQPYLHIKIFYKNGLSAFPGGNYDEMENHIKMIIGSQDIQRILLDASELGGMIDSAALGKLQFLSDEKPLVIVGLKGDNEKNIRKLTLVRQASSAEEGLELLLK